MILVLLRKLFSRKSSTTYIEIVLPCVDDIFCIQVDHFFEADRIDVDRLVFGVVRALT